MQGHQSPALAWAKYAATLGFTALRAPTDVVGTVTSVQTSPRFSHRAKRLMGLLGVLDVTCYVFNCVGECFIARCVLVLLVSYNCIINIACHRASSELQSKFVVGAG